VKGWSDPNSMLGKRIRFEGPLNGLTKVQTLKSHPLGWGYCFDDLVFHMMMINEQLNPDVYCAECQK